MKYLTYSMHTNTGEVSKKILVFTLYAANLNMTTEVL